MTRHSGSFRRVEQRRFVSTRSSREGREGAFCRDRQPRARCAGPRSRNRELVFVRVRRQFFEGAGLDFMCFVELHFVSVVGLRAQTRTDPFSYYGVRSAGTPFALCRVCDRAPQYSGPHAVRQSREPTLRHSIPAPRLCYSRLKSMGVSWSPREVQYGTLALTPEVVRRSYIVYRCTDAQRIVHCCMCVCVRSATLGRMA